MHLTLYQFLMANSGYKVHIQRCVFMINNKFIFTEFIVCSAKNCYKKKEKEKNAFSLT